MTEGELIRLVKQIVKKEFAQILLAQVTTTDNSYSTSIQRFATDSEVSGLRMIQPYGFASRPPANTPTLVVPINSDPSHLVAVGQFDQGNRPDLDDGESVLYGPDGQVIYMKSGGTIHQGSEDADEPAVLGNVLKTLMDAVINAFLNATQIGVGPTGPVMLDPGVRTNLTTAQQQYVDTASTNFLSQNNFVERGT